MALTRYNFIKENYLNTIGNLTLSGNNGKLGNKSFIDKRDLEEAGYKDSRLWLNKDLQSLTSGTKLKLKDVLTLLQKEF
ncbi:MAG: DUF1524 domain-containing protein [Chitinophagaceae bacterium]